MFFSHQKKLFIAACHRVATGHAGQSNARELHIRLDIRLAPSHIDGETFEHSETNIDLDEYITFLCNIAYYKYLTVTYSNIFLLYLQFEKHVTCIYPMYPSHCPNLEQGYDYSR